MIGDAQNPEQITRILFQDFPVWMIATFYVVAIVAIGVFCWGVWVQIRKYLRGAHGKTGLTHVWARVKDTIGVIRALSF